MLFIEMQPSHKSNQLIGKNWGRGGRKKILNLNCSVLAEKRQKSARKAPEKRQKSARKAPEKRQKNVIKTSEKV